MVQGIPAVQQVTCPRCKTIRFYDNVDGGTQFRCQGCEWYWTFSAVAPTGTSSGAITAGVTTAITVAAGGASFTTGMLLLYDTGASAEVVTVVGTATATNIPVPGGFIKSHLTGATFGQLSINPTYSVADTVPHANTWGY